MLIHNHPLFRIYFGDAKDKLFSQDYLGLPKGKKIYELGQFANLKKVIHLEALVFLKQVHGTNGLVIDSLQQAKDIKCFSQEGDFLVTNVKRVGLGVMTADCLPIVFFDKRKLVVAVAHAGWRSSVGQIGAKTVDAMQKAFGTQIEDIKVFFGPSAKACCYKVSDDFIENLGELEFLDRVMQRRSDGLYFDLPLYNMLLLESLGIKKEAISLQYNDCTVCNKLLFSHRRQMKAGTACTGQICASQMDVAGRDIEPKSSDKLGDADEFGGRQMTVVCLT